MNDADDFVAYPPAVRPLLRADEHVGKAGEGGVEEGLDSGRDEERRREEHRENQHHQANDRHGPSRIGCPEITMIFYSTWNQQDSSILDFFSLNGCANNRAIILAIIEVRPQTSENDCFIGLVSFSPLQKAVA